jgi:hypothetical protein
MCVQKFLQEKNFTVTTPTPKMVLIINLIQLSVFLLAIHDAAGERGVDGGNKPFAVIVCIPPCPDGSVICTWDNGGNGYNGSTSCQRSCGDPVGSGAACKASANHTCYWGWSKDSGWACFSGAPPCSGNDSVIGSAYMTCADLQRGYGGCTHTSDCSQCCSKTCYCQDLEEEKSMCVCGTK